MVNALFLWLLREIKKKTATVFMVCGLKLTGFGSNQEIARLC